jgi:hypothetical protein
MSIYATLWELKFPLYGQSHTDCEWETVIAQGVPEHIGEDGNADYLAFLPPRETSIEDGLRAVVFVRKLQEKGTERSAQEYSNPLLMISGKEYSSANFANLYERLVNALLGTRPRVVAEIRESTGTIRIIYEDGNSQIVQSGTSEA